MRFAASRAGRTPVARLPSQAQARRRARSHFSVLAAAAATVESVRRRFANARQSRRADAHRRPTFSRPTSALSRRNVEACASAQLRSSDSGAAGVGTTARVDPSSPHPSTTTISVQVRVFPELPRVHARILSCAFLASSLPAGCAIALTKDFEGDRGTEARTVSGSRPGDYAVERCIKTWVSSE
jgi:hypothetical protein